MNVWLDSTDNGQPAPGGVNCNNVQTCSYDQIINTYCWAVGVPHKFGTSCSQSCGGGSSNSNAGGFTTAPGTKPSLSISYDPSTGHLTKTWSFTEPPPQFVMNHQKIVTCVNGSCQESSPSSYESYAPSGTDSSFIGLGTCGGDRIVKVYADACNVALADPYWVTEQDLTIPDPGGPNVSVSIVPQSDPTKFDAVVTYHFPSSGTRQLDVKLLKKPNDSDGVPLGNGTYYPASTDGQLDPIHLPVVSDEAFVAAFATVTGCNPKKAVAGFTSCCQTGPPQSVGSPIDLVTGSMRMNDTDSLPSAVLPLTRSYDSANTTRGVFGTGWTSYLDAAVALDGTGANQIVVVNTEANNRYAFTLNGGIYTQLWPRGSERDSVLSGNPTSGFTFREAGSDIIRTFDPSGRIVAISSSRQNRSLTISYDGNGHVSRVDDSYGIVTLLLTTDAATGRVTRIDVSGRSDIFWTYQYSSNLLIGVTAPDGHTWRTYQYAAGLLTAALDPLGNTIEAHTYDSSGRAISSSQSTNDIQNIEHLAGRTSDEVLTRVTYASGKVTSYYSKAAGSSMITADVFNGCSACSSENATYVFDAAGHVLKKQDARGYITQYTYLGNALSSTLGPLKPPGCDPQTDSNHCRLSIADLTSAVPETTALSLGTGYVYGDSRWPDRPTLITTSSVANGSATKQEALFYDAVTGEVLVSGVTGWVSPTQSETHTTTTTLYNGTEGPAFDPGPWFSRNWMTLHQPAGLRKSVDGPRTDVTDLTQFVYYPIDASVPANNRGKLAAMVNWNNVGLYTTYANYDVFGNAGTVTDPNQVVMNTAYDTLGRLVSTTWPAISGCDTTADPVCNIDIVNSRTFSPGGGPLATETKPRGGVTSYTYDGRGRVASITRTISSTVSERIEYDYDPSTGQKSAERVLDNSSGSFVIRKSVSYSYDAEGHLTEVLYPDNANALYTYDIAGALATAQDENHSAANTFYDYNEAGRVRAVRQTLGTSQISTTYGYDAQGNLTSVTDPNGNVTTYAYDDFGRMTRQISPVTGQTTYAYDTAGNLITTVDANGTTTLRTYDPLSRVTAAFSSFSGSYTAEYTSWGYDNFYAQGAFGVGRLSGMSYPNGSTFYVYERRGLLRSEWSNLGGAAYTTTYTYDPDGNRTSITYPDGSVASYSYDLAGRPLSLQGAITSAQYLPFGPLTTLSYGNGTTKTMSYDSRYRITENKLTGPAGIIADYTYSEDAVGNITAIHDATDASYNRDFAFDDLNRLVTANSGASLWGTGSYAYDAMGNLTSRSLGTAPVDDGTVLSVPGRHFRAKGAVTGVVDKLAFTYNSTTPKIAVTTWNGVDHTVTYDAAGNETSYFATRTYSPRNLLATVTDNSGEGPPHTVSYGYDARGVRVVRSESPTSSGTANRYFTYSPELQLLAITDDDSPNLWASGHANTLSAPIAPSHEFAYFNGLPVVEWGTPRTPDSTVELSMPRHAPFAVATTLYYTFTDHLGTPLLQTDSSGAVVWRAEHEPYGNVYLMRKGARTDQPLRLPGQDLAMTWEGAEENYNIFRWYRGGWGRYTQADPARFRGGLNLFAYAASNPLGFIDTLGLVCGIKVHSQEITYSKDAGWQNAYKNTWGHSWLEWPGGSAGFWPKIKPSTPFQSVPGMVQIPDPDSKVDLGGWTVLETYYDGFQAPKCKNCAQTVQCISNFALNYQKAPQNYCLATNNCQSFTAEALAHCGLTTTTPFNQLESMK